MKLTRYFQSCLLVEEGGVRVLIDPSGQEAERFDEFGRPDAVLYTHEHADHFDPELAERFKEAGVAVYANKSTAGEMLSAPIVVTNGQEITLKGLKVKAIELPHCLMWDGRPGPQNTGFQIGERLFHAGDGKELKDYSIEVLALPITGPDVSLKDAFAFVKQVGAKTALPIHYDYIGTKPEVFAGIAEGNFDFAVKVLEPGRAAEL